MANIALFPGSYKPPHIGHYTAAKQAAQIAGKVKVFVGSGEREGITQGMSVQLWELYTQNDPNIEIIQSLSSPVTDVYDYVELEAKDGDIIYFIKGDKDADDPRFKNIEKYAEKVKKKIKKRPINVLDVKSRTGKEMSGRLMRAYIKSEDKRSFIDGLPEGINGEQAWNIVTGLEELYNKPQSGEQPYGDTTRYHDHWKSNDLGPKKPVEPAYKYKRRNFPKSMYESRGGESELHIYDFDETIARVETPIPYTVESPEGKIIEKGETTSIEFEETKDYLKNLHKENIKINWDFKAFANLISKGTLNNEVFQKLLKSIENPNAKVTILTARAIGLPVTKFLKDQGIWAYVVPLGLNKEKGQPVTGEDKANWIEKRIKDTTKKVIFIDDAPENRKAIYTLKNKYPNIEFDVETPPKINENYTTSSALINDIPISLETMITPDQQMKGMMGRDSLDGGMLFPYDRVQQRDFHMKNCKMSLDIIFIKQGKINNIHSDCPPCKKNKCPNYSGMADNVLEFPGGYCNKNNVNIGDEINLTIDNTPPQSPIEINETKYGSQYLLAQYKDKIQLKHGHQQYRNLQTLMSQQKDEEVETWLKTKGYLNEEIDEGEVADMFKYNLELQKIGTEEQYSQYLTKIFPNSKIKDIVYHGSNYLFDKFEKKVNPNNKYSEGSYNGGWFFAGKKATSEFYTDSKILAKITNFLSISKGKTPTVYSIMLNIQNPIIEDRKGEAGIGFEEVNNAIAKGNDAYIAKNVADPSVLDTVYVVFDPKDIHILGSKQDIKDFTSFTSKLNETMTKLFSKNWWLDIINEHILTEGGAAGHMAHPFNLPNVNSGKDLKDLFVKASDSLQSNPGAVKIDGVNSSIRLIDLNGQKQFVMDRGSKKPLDIKGITKDDLENRFKPGHGMVKVGGEVLDMFNEALPSLEADLKKLGVWEDPNILFNMEYVSGKTNVQDYGSNFIAIHGLNKIESKEVQGKRGPLIKRASTEVSYDKAALQSMLDNLKPIAEKNDFEVYGSVPTEVKGKPNFGAALNTSYTIKSNKGDKTQSLDKWLNELNNIPEEDFIFMNVNGIKKKVGAVSKQVYVTLLKGDNIDELYESEEDKQKAIEGFTTYLATEKLGDEILKILDSPMGTVDNHEGVVIRDEKIANVPFKITGKFILGGMVSDF